MALEPNKFPHIRPMSTLKITVGQVDRLDRETRERVHLAERDVEMESAAPVLNFASYRELGRLLSEKNLELLETIVHHEPQSIAETAELVGRDYKQVHRNLTELESLGLISFHGDVGPEGKTPEFQYDGIEIDLPFTDREGRAGVATP